MKQNDGHVRFLVDGMTCVSCETKIEQTLKGTAGVVAVSARYVTSEVDVSFDRDQTTTGTIEDVLRQMDYPVLERVALDSFETTVPHRDGRLPSQDTLKQQAVPVYRKQQAVPVYRSEHARKSLLASIGKLAGLLIALLALAMLINQVGGLNLFYAFPVAEAGMGLGMLFIIGLLTSVH